MAFGVHLDKNVWGADDAVSQARLKLGNLVQQLVAGYDRPLVFPAAKQRVQLLAGEPGGITLGADVVQKQRRPFPHITELVKGVPAAQL